MAFDFGPSLPDECSPSLKLFGSSYPGKVAVDSGSESKFSIPANTYLTHLHIGFVTNLSVADANAQIQMISFVLGTSGYWFVSNMPRWMAVPGQTNQSYTLAKHVIIDSSGNIVTSPVKTSELIVIDASQINASNKFNTPGVAVYFYTPSTDTTTPVHMAWGVKETTGPPSTTPPSSPVRKSNTLSATVPAGGASIASAWWLAGGPGQVLGPANYNVTVNGKTLSPSQYNVLPPSPTPDTCTKCGSYCCYQITFTFTPALPGGSTLSVQALKFGKPSPFAWWDSSGVSFGSTSISGRKVGPATTAEPTNYDAASPFCDIFTGNAPPRTDSLDLCECTAPNCICRHNSSTPNFAGIVDFPTFYTQDAVREGVMTEIQDPASPKTTCTSDSNCSGGEFCCIGANVCYSSLTSYCTPEGVVRSNSGSACTTQSDCSGNQVCCVGRNGAGLCHDTDFTRCSTTASGAPTITPTPYFYQRTPFGGGRTFGAHTTSFSNSNDQDVDYVCTGSDSSTCCQDAVTMGVANRDGSAQAPRCPVGTFPGFATDNFAKYCQPTTPNGAPAGVFTGTASFGCFSKTQCSDDSECLSPNGCLGGICQCSSNSDCDANYQCEFGLCAAKPRTGYTPFRTGQARLLPYENQGDVELAVSNCFSTIPQTTDGWTATKIDPPSYIPDGSSGYDGQWRGLQLTDTLSDTIQFGDYYLSKKKGQGAALGKVLIPELVQCSNLTGCEDDRARNLFLGGQCCSDNTNCYGVPGGQACFTKLDCTPTFQQGQYYLMDS